MPTVAEHLEYNRKELLDLGTRNRLISIPKASKSARLVHVIDERSDEVFRILVQEKKAMSFLPGRKSSESGEEDGDEDDLGEVGSETGTIEDQEDGMPKRHTDSKLQTALTPEGLARRLLALHTDARTIEEEQGVNVLYLALGQLEWLEDASGQGSRFAPLVLIPVELKRETASDKFKLRWNEQEIQENLSLVTKLKADFGLEMPEFGEHDDFVPSKYFAAVRKALKSTAGWNVLGDEMTIGFFSFSKLMMFRDLQPENWPNGKEIDKSGLVSRLLVDGFEGEPALFDDGADLDQIIPVNRLDHVVDADGSQAAVVEIVRSGRNLIVQGPPGTGKSQTIVNILAAAVLDGKRVLFVAEKLAALEVVKRRLEANGLGALCLELHSNKANKKSVLADLAATWDLGRPVGGGHDLLFAKLEKLRQTLNTHCASMHTALEPCGLTPFKIIGALVRLKDFNRSSVDLDLRDPGSWTPGTVAEIRKDLEDLGARLAIIGLPGANPWRGVQRKHFLRIDAEPLLRKLRNLAARIEAARAALQILAGHLLEPTPSSPAESDQVLVLADHVAKAPPLDRGAICNGVWNAGLGGLKEIIACGREFTDTERSFGSEVPESTWTKDITETRNKIAAHGLSLFRILVSEYRAAFRDLRVNFSGPIPKAYADRLTLLDRILAGQKLRSKLGGFEALGQSAFGSFWKCEKSDWKQLDQIFSWVDQQVKAGLGASFRKMFAGVSDTDVVASAAAEVRSTRLGMSQALAEVTKELDLNFAEAFGATDPGAVPFTTLQERIAEWMPAVERLPDWVAYHSIRENLRAAGAGKLVEAIELQQIQTNDLLLAFNWTYYSELLRILVRERPEFGTFDGLLHGRSVADFREADRERLRCSILRTLAAHHSRMPPKGDGVGVTGIIKSEIARKRGHMPIRKLLAEAGQAVQAIKPIFMMSPLSVAQFLEPGKIEFDLLVIDEASQVEPVDALGAIARSKQVVVVGDSKQLPPSHFFQRATSDSTEDDDFDSGNQNAAPKDMESILGLCEARGIPPKMLRWHYRSRHHSLIAVSNHEFYDNGLFIVPSPTVKSSEYGLRFNFVEGGIFDSGKTAVNKLEAQTVAGAVMRHAERFPTASLGVAAFSVRQRQAIQDELEILRPARPDTESFFNSHPHEPFFVKNLENVQGDERDVIFISIGYARDPSGYLAMRFGPLSIDGGERRLNVLISRAKNRCEVFSSIRSDDIDLARAGGRGVAALKSFLRFAETGVLGNPKTGNGEEDSPFEESVRAELEKNGLTVDCQVGEAGFFIDLAVRDPENSGSYILGIECDGAAYHSSRSARDRDRLRQAVLEDHGWNIHRIWSTDWLQRPERELRNALLAVERAREAARKGRRVEAEVTAPPATETVTRVTVPEPEVTATPYEMAVLNVPAGVGELGTMVPGQIVRYVTAVLDVEAPIHPDEVVTRIRSAWGYERAGNRIHTLVSKAAKLALNDPKYGYEEGFLVNRQKPVVPRRREDDLPLSLRKPEYLPPSEIRAAIVEVAERHLGVDWEDLRTAVARLLGFKATSSQIGAAIDAQIRSLLNGGIVTATDGVVRRSSSANADSTKLGNAG